ncbi:MAG: hypothetical protein GX663_08250 [Clostridiales bacterium]|nr:hypothetical protein [Clostridiales bacterium]
MNKKIVTNNPKVVERLKENSNIEVCFQEGAPTTVYETVREKIEEGGRLFTDIKKIKSGEYYISIPVLMSGEGSSPDNIQAVETCLGKAMKKGKTFEKPPVMAEKHQEKNLKALEAVMSM